MPKYIKFIYSEKATKFWEIFPLLLTYSTYIQNKGKILQNFVAFSEYMNFTRKCPRKTPFQQTVPKEHLGKPDPCVLKIKIASKVYTKKAGAAHACFFFLLIACVV